MSCVHFFSKDSHANRVLTNLSEGENDKCSSHASPSRPRLLQLLLFPLLLDTEGR